jgi:drug/metabolite transporter (DMT)-like permease
MVVAGCIVTQFAGTALASAHDGALLTTITPVFVVPLAWLLLGERPGWRIIAGMLLALAGVVIVVAAQVAGPDAGLPGNALLGDALLLFSAFCWALFTVLGAPLTRRFTTLPAVTAATLWSIPFMLPLAAIELALRPHGDALALTPASAGAVLYLAWGATALAWFLWYRGVEKLPAAVAAVFFFAQPLAGGILSAVFLRESLGAGFWLGGAVLAAGIVVVAAGSR